MQTENINENIAAEVKCRLDQIAREATGQTDVLYSNDFTARADCYLMTLSEERQAVAQQLLESGSYMYFHDEHDWDKEPFDEAGNCRHGLNWWTCSAGCGEL